MQRVIDALAQDNLAQMLAEPNLTVMSGQTASFQVGGEFPIPVSETNGAMSIDFKNYGILLSFLPTVMSDGRINMHVKPEVSELDKADGIQLTAGNSSVSRSRPDRAPGREHGGTRQRPELRHRRPAAADDSRQRHGRCPAWATSRSSARCSAIEQLPAVGRRAGDRRHAVHRASGEPCRRPCTCQPTATTARPISSACC